jgi:uncharacterized integral membrane protein (TIGR00697 family)
LISGKSIPTPIFPIIAGIVPWPVVFLLTDVMNEYFGKQAVKRLSWITVGLIAFCFLIVFIAVELPVASNSPLTDQEFRKVFSGSLPIMIGSICAFLFSQLIDVRLFVLFSKLTRGKMIWLRSTGSTMISQLVDSYTVLFIGFVLPGVITFEEFLGIGFMNYLVKLVIAVGLTPFVYVMHFLAGKILGDKHLAYDEAGEELEAEE